MAEEQKESGKFDFLKKIFGKKSENPSSSEEMESSDDTSSLKETSPKKVSKNAETEETINESSAYLQILAENTMSFQQMVKDINISRQNVQKLVEIMGGEKKTAADEEFKTESQKRELVDERKSEIKATQEEDTEQESKVERVTDEDFFKEQDQKEAELESGGEPASLQVPGEDGGGEKKGKKGSLIGKFIKGKIGKFAKGKLGKAGKLLDFKKAFSLKSILGAFKKYIVIGAILGVIFMAFKDTIIEWVKSAWNAIVEKLSELWSMLKDWFVEAVQPILKAIGDFVQPLIDAVSSFFSKIMDFVVSYFTFWKDLILSPVETIKKVWDKFMGVLDWYKGLWRDAVQGAMSLPVVGAGITKVVKAIGLDKFLGIGKVEPKKVDAKKEKEDNDKKEKEDTAKKQADDSKKQAEETARKQAEEKAKSSAPKGFIEEVQERQVPKRPEEKKSEPAPEPAPTPTPAPAPTPTPVPTVEKKEEVKPPPKIGPAAEEPSKKVEVPSVAKPGEQPKPSETKPTKISKEVGKKAVIKAMDDKKITDPTARAAIMAQIGHESGGFTTLSENLNYKPQTLLKIFPKYFKTKEDAEQTAAAGPVAIANKVYGGRMGNAPDEGFKYRGRGFIQLTGKDNYKKFGYAGNPDDVATPDAGADSALKYILQYKGDWGDIKKLTKFVNGGYIGLEDRIKHFEEYKNDPEIIKVGAVSTATSGSSVSSASNEIASGQREQQKPTTPVIINSPTTNNTTVQQNKIPPSSQPKNTANALVTRTT